jgi:hypothetical protein
MKDVPVPLVGQILLFVILMGLVLWVVVTKGGGRLHDVDHSAWWLVAICVPILGQAISLLLLVAPGTKGPNRFGPDPRERGRGISPPAPGVTAVPLVRERKEDHMAEAVAYLSDNPGPSVPFRFRLGDRVISTLDRSSSGVIVWGRCRYTVGGGGYEDIYEVERPDGRYFLAKHHEIERQPGQPAR